MLSCITDVVIMIFSRCVGYPNPPAPSLIVEIRYTMFYITDRVETFDRDVKKLHSFSLSFVLKRLYLYLPSTLAIMPLTTETIQIREPGQSVLL